MARDFCARRSWRAECLLAFLLAANAADLAWRWNMQGPVALTLKLAVCILVIALLGVLVGSRFLTFRAASSEVKPLAPLYDRLMSNELTSAVKN